MKKLITMENIKEGLKEEYVKNEASEISGNFFLFFFETKWFAHDHVVFMLKSMFSCSSPRRGILLGPTVTIMRVNTLFSSKINMCWLF